jgi:hypothetical protein
MQVVVYVITLLVVFFFTRLFAPAKPGQQTVAAE